MFVVINVMVWENTKFGELHSGGGLIVEYVTHPTVPKSVGNLNKRSMIRVAATKVTFRRRIVSFVSN